MPAALLAVLMLTATIDPRLAEPLRLLAEVGARDTTDGHAGQFFADLPDSLGLTLAVGELPGRAAGRYLAGIRTVTVSEAVAAEDPRIVAVVLAHELQHALDRKRQALGLLEVDCLALEVRGFEAQAHVTRLFWPDELPNGTALERHVALVVRDRERAGTAGLAARLAGDAAYREACVRSPENSALSTCGRTGPIVTIGGRVVECGTRLTSSRRVSEKPGTRPRQASTILRRNRPGF